MRAEIWYAAIVAVSLLLAAALWALITAPTIARADIDANVTRAVFTLPSPPPLSERPRPSDGSIAALQERDLFGPRRESQTAALRVSRPRLAKPTPSRPRIGSALADAVPVPVPTETRAPTLPARTPAVLSRETIPERVQPRPRRDAGLRFRLRGVFPDPRGARAVLALSDGRLQTVGIGSEVGSWRVMEIGRAAIRLGRTGETIVLAMPNY